MKTKFIIISVAILAAIALTGCKEEPAKTVAEGEGAVEAIVEAVETVAADISVAPQLTLKDTEGSEHSLSDYLGKIVVLEWTNSDCPFVKRHLNASTMIDLADEYSGKGVVWLAINSTHYADRKMNIAAIAEYGVTYPVLDDSSGEVGRLYDAKTTPHLFVIDAAGNIAYEGAIDNDRAGDKEEVINYVRKALDEMLAGEEVSTPFVKPYGCTVKYAE